MRVSFLVDGFNVYHSIRDAEKHVPSRPQRWLDLRSFCQDYVRHFGRSAVLQEVYYFSAIARHLEASKPDIGLRHQAYLDALKAAGVQVTLANFKWRDKHTPLKYCSFRIWSFRQPIRIPISGSVIIRHAEEKETDVAIACKLLELLHTDAADAIVLVSGDTDLLPAIGTARRLFPAARVAVLFPFRRHNAELKQAVAQSFKVRKEQYAAHQFPDPVALPSGAVIRKPPTW